MGPPTCTPWSRFCSRSFSFPHFVIFFLLGTDVRYTSSLFVLRLLSSSSPIPPHHLETLGLFLLLLSPSLSICLCLLFLFQDNDLRAAIKMDEHTIPIEDLYARWNIDPEIGLTTKQVLKLQDGGNNLNQLTPPKEMSEIMKLLHTQTGPFNLLLWAGAILCFIGYGLQQSVDNLYLGIVLTTVVSITGIFEYLQERNASTAASQIKRFSSRAFRMGSR